MRTIVFLSCCKSKLDHPAPARELYTGALFRKALAYAEQVLYADAIYVFSAKYGVVGVDEVIAPYSLVMKNSGTIKEDGIGMTAAAIKEWRAKVIPQVEALVGQHRPIYLCNSSYREGMPAGNIPMEGMVFGQCLQWLTNQLEEKK